MEEKKNIIVSQEGIIPVFQKKLIVKKADLDENGHVNNICYVQWMQELAIDHSACLGWPGSRYLEHEVMWVVHRHTIDYLRQAWINDEIKAETWVAEMKRVSSVRCYQFTRVSDGTVLVKAETLWGFVSTKTGHLVRILKEVDEIFQQLISNKQ